MSNKWSLGCRFTRIVKYTLIYFQTTINNCDCIIDIIKKSRMNLLLVRKYPLHKCKIAKDAICKILFAATRKIM